MPELPDDPGEDKAPKQPTSTEEGYYKRQYDKAQSELDKLRKSQLSESERHRAEAKDWEQKANSAVAELSSLKLNMQCMSIAQESGCASPKAVAKLLAEYVERDPDTGAVTNAEKALASVKKDAPGLFKPASASPTGFAVTERPATKQTLGHRMDAIIRNQLGLIGDS